MLISQFFFEIINLIFYSIYITYSCIIACFPGNNCPVKTAEYFIPELS